MAVGFLKFETSSVTCAASTAATRVASTIMGKVYKALTVVSPIDNAGTLYVGHTSALAVARTAVPVLPGNSFDIGPVPTGGRTWGDIDPTTVFVSGGSGTADSIVFAFLTSQ